MSDSRKVVLPPEIVVKLNRLKEYYSRDKIDPIEEAEILNELVEQPPDRSRRPYLTITEAAKELNISRGAIYLKKRLLNLAPELKKAVREGRLGLWEASDLAKKSPEDQIKVFKRTMKAKKQDG